MPELPEAETIARQLQRKLAGKIFGRVAVVRPDIIHGLADLPEAARVAWSSRAGPFPPRPDATLLDAIIPGRRVVRVRRRAKRVHLELEGGLTLVFRLGMTGRLGVVHSITPLEKHTHLRVRIAGTPRELRFTDPRRFGGVWVFGGSDGDEIEDQRKLGLEPLDANVREFREALRRRRQIKALLMDQSAIAGLGNIYCDESLHAARIHPWTQADRLNGEAAARLLRAIKMTLRRAIRFNGSTLMDYRDAAGREGSFQKLHRVYQREGRPCRTCHTPIRRIQAAGRSTFFCPKCQPEKQKRRKVGTSDQSRER